MTQKRSDNKKKNTKMKYNSCFFMSMAASAPLSMVFEEAVKTPSKIELLHVLIFSSYNKHL